MKNMWWMTRRVRSLNGSMRKFPQLSPGMVVLGIVALLCAGVGILAACTRQSSTPPVAKPAVTHSAPASPTPAVPTETPTDIAFLNWYHGNGYQDFQTVVNDLTNMDTATKYDNTAGIESGGQLLALDAQEAEGFPCPVDQTDYLALMRLYALAGNDAAQGDFTGAAGAFAVANAPMSSLTAAVKAETARLGA